MAELQNPSGENFPNGDQINKNLAQVAEELKNIAAIIAHKTVKEKADRNRLKNDIWTSQPWTTPRCLFGVNIDRILSGEFSQKAYENQYFSVYADQYPVLPIFKSDKGTNFLGSWIDGVVPNDSLLRIAGVSPDGNEYHESIQESVLVDLNKGSVPVLIEFALFNGQSDLLTKALKGSISVGHLAIAASRMEMVQLLCEHHEIPRTKNFLFSVLREVLMTEERVTSLNFLIDFVNFSSNLDDSAEIDIEQLIRQLSRILRHPESSVCPSVRHAAKLERCRVQTILSNYKRAKHRGTLWGYGGRKVVESLEQSGVGEEFLPTVKMVSVVMKHAKKQMEEETKQKENSAEEVVKYLVGARILEQHGGNKKRRPSVSSRDILQCIGTLQRAIETGDLYKHKDEFEALMSNAKQVSKRSRRRHVHRRAKSHAHHRCVGGRHNKGKNYVSMDSSSLRDMSHGKGKSKRRRGNADRIDDSDLEDDDKESSSNGESESSSDDL